MTKSLAGFSDNTNSGIGPDQYIVCAEPNGTNFTDAIVCGSEKSKN
jgi:hypothetical protein